MQLWLRAGEEDPEEDPEEADDGVEEGGDEAAGDNCLTENIRVVRPCTVAGPAASGDSTPMRDLMLPFNPGCIDSFGCSSGITGVGTPTPIRRDAPARRLLIGIAEVR
ncbi:hypothetical protein CLOM_g17564 [Closterium sp. NIES-68]|nr:hypothetical protein CLOM_g17564 [Closterium sp. NIES-68]